MKILDLQPQIFKPQKKLPENPNVKTTNCLWGGFWGYLGACAVGSFNKDAREFIIDGRNNLTKYLPADEVKILNTAADKFIEKKGLASKGISVINVTSENIADSANEYLNKFKQYYSKFHPKMSKDGLQARKINNQIKNAISKFEESLMEAGTFYDKKLKTLVVNGKNPGLGIFDTVSRLAQNPKGAMGVLSKLSYVSLLTVPIVLTAVCSRNKKAPQGQELSKKDKFTNFVRQNAGKLTMLAFVPSILYSGACAARAITAAHKFLPKKLQSEVAAHEAVTFAAAFMTAPIAGLAAVCGVDTKDFMQNYKDQKAYAQAEQAQNPAAPANINTTASKV